MNILKSNDIPKWMMNLEKEDFEFVKNFVINSGSLKALAKYYEVSYKEYNLQKTMKKVH